MSDPIKELDQSLLGLSQVVRRMVKQIRALEDRVDELENPTYNADKLVDGLDITDNE